MKLTLSIAVALLAAPTAATYKTRPHWNEQATTMMSALLHSHPVTAVENFISDHLRRLTFNTKNLHITSRRGLGGASGGATGAAGWFSGGTGGDNYNYYSGSTGGATDGATGSATSGGCILNFHEIQQCVSSKQEMMQMNPPTMTTICPIYQDLFECYPSCFCQGNNEYSNIWEETRNSAKSSLESLGIGDCTLTCGQHVHDTTGPPLAHSMCGHGTTYDDAHGQCIASFHEFVSGCQSDPSQPMCGNHKDEQLCDGGTHSDPEDPVCEAARAITHKDDSGQDDSGLYTAQCYHVDTRANTEDPTKWIFNKGTGSCSVCKEPLKVSFGAKCDNKNRDCKHCQGVIDAYKDC